jgi:putative nucleotidyltransferase with HDIG domain
MHVAERRMTDDREVQLAERAGPHPHRIPAAFEKLASLPALAESRNRLLRVLLAPESPPEALTRAIEADVALTVAVLRSANHVARTRKLRRRPTGIASIPEAIELVTPEGVGVLARRIGVVDFFDRLPGWATLPDHFRLHATATQELAEQLAADLDPAARNELLVGALLHDVGKLVLMEAYEGYPDPLLGEAKTPEQKLASEQRRLGMDHAVVGGVLVRRWGLPDRLAALVERHHEPMGNRHAALVRLADLLVHHRQGRPVEREGVAAAAAEAGIDAGRLRELMFEGAAGARSGVRNVEPSPLSPKQRAVLRGLASGKVHKEIAADLDMSASTVRTHLHQVYRKLGVVDRAQAVLRATERGWL